MANLGYFTEIAKEVFKAETDSNGNFQFYPRLPKLSDIQLIAMITLAESQGIDSENYLFAQIKATHPEFYEQLPDRSNYNRRKRRLCEKTGMFNQQLAARMTLNTDRYLIDSMPLPICRIARAKRCRIMKDDLQMLPQTGYQPIDQQYYHGYKLHALTTDKGVITSYFITQANVHDVKIIKDLAIPFIPGKMLIGDKGYIGKEIQLDLFNDAQISLYTPARNNMQKSTIWKNWMGGLRKRLETVFSQQCDQFLLNPSC